MIPIIIGLIAACVYSYFTFKTHTDAPPFNVIFNGILMGLLIWFATEIIFLLTFAGGKATRVEQTPAVQTTNIVALQDVNSTSGRFFLGSGSVGQKTYYAYYYKTEYGYRYATIDANNSLKPVYIQYIQSEDETPRIEHHAVLSYTYRTDYNPIWWSLIATWRYSGYSDGELIAKEVIPQMGNSGRYVIYIPEGSIKEDYEIDLN